MLIIGPPDGEEPLEMSTYTLPTPPSHTYDGSVSKFGSIRRRNPTLRLRASSNPPIAQIQPTKEIFSLAIDFAYPPDSHLRHTPLFVPLGDIKEEEKRDLEERIKGQEEFWKTTFARQVMMEKELESLLDGEGPIVDQQETRTKSAKRSRWRNIAWYIGKSVLAVGVIAWIIDVLFHGRPVRVWRIVGYGQWNSSVPERL